MDDCWFDVFLLLDFKDATALSIVSKKLNDISNDEYLWKQYYDMYYSGKTLWDTYFETCREIDKIIRFEKIKIFAMNYNFLRVCSGMAGLSYST